MKQLRIVCGNVGALHYTSTPELAMDTCPVCGEGTREIEIDISDTPVAKTLLDLLYEADAIQIDDIFVRHFHMEFEDCEEGEDLVLSVEVELEYNLHEYAFTLGELQTATKNVGGEGFVVGDGQYGGSTLTPYKLTELKA